MKSRRAMLALWVLCQLVALMSSVWMLAAIVAGSPRAWRIAISYDQLGNATTGGNEDETISSRANRARSERRRWGCLLCRLLDSVDKDHCAKSAGS